MSDGNADASQLAAVLEQIAEHSADEDIRGHVRQVAEALRGSGLIIMDGPPQREMRRKAGERMGG